MTFFSSFTTKKEKHIYTYTHLESNKDKDLISTPPPPSHKKNNQRDQREKTKVISSSRFLQNSRVKKNFINYPIPGRNFHRILLSPPFAVIKLALSSTRSLPALLSFFFPPFNLLSITLLATQQPGQTLKPIYRAQVFGIPDRIVAFFEQHEWPNFSPSGTLMKRVPLLEGARSSIEFLADRYPAINRKPLSLSLPRGEGSSCNVSRKGLRATPGRGKTMEERFIGWPTREGILYRPITPSYRLSRCKPYLQRNRVLLVRLNA